jgi:hypothetical protein
MQESEGIKMLKRLFHRKKKQSPPPTPVVAPKASKQTKDAIAFFNGKKPAVDLIEDDKRKKFHHSGYVRTWKDDAYDTFFSSDFWGTVALALVAALIVGIMFWGFNQ